MINPYDIYITPEEYEIAASHGVPAAMLDRRVRQQAWPKEKAMTTSPRKHKPRGYYADWIALAARNGIKCDAFFSRINRGWSEEDSATKPLESAIEVKEHALKATEHARVFPEEFLRLAEQNGIPYHTFRMRVIKSKWSYERAATEPKWTKQQIGKFGAQRLREREGDWAAQLFGKKKAIR